MKNSKNKPELIALNTEELSNINAGGWVKVIVKGIEIFGIADAIKDAASGFVDGFKNGPL